MKASESKILRFIDGGDKKFIIPVYQRPYSWKKDNCIQLMKDLKDVIYSNFESHFFGSIVFVSQNNGACEEHTIIDGQQRITTVSLLLLALRNYVLLHPELEINVNPNKITNAYLTDEYSNNEKKLKLKLVQGDDEAYDNLVENNSPIENTSITANYNYFYGEIEKMTPHEIEDLNNAIGKLDIVSISLQPQNGDDPQLIFDSLNSTGQKLEPSDKIRNFVLMRMASSQQEKFYKRYWEPLESKVTREELDKFIRYYLAVKLRKLCKEDKLYFEFKKFQESSKRDIETIIQDMLEFAEYYKNISKPLAAGQSWSTTLARINKLEIKTCVPLLMDIFKANAEGFISTEELCDAFRVIENYIIRREICDLPTNALNKVFVQLGAEVEKDIEDKGMSYYDALRQEIMKKTGKSRFPNAQEFEDKFMTYDLYNTKSSIKKYILERLENYQNRELVTVEELIDNGTLTIEHIMPQSLTPEWKEMLGEKWELVHTKYKDTIGNLTLTAYNSDYSNSPFKAKKTMPEKGFVFSKLFLNVYVKSCNEWNEDKILERASELFKKASEIWWMPEKLVVENEVVDEWVDWDEDVDITNKRISQVTIMESVINTVDVTAAYKAIHQTLYDLDPTIYHNNQFAWFAKSDTTMRKPCEIGINAYIETNKSSQEKLNTIKAVADLCHLESGDLRFLIQEKPDVFSLDNESTYSKVTVGKLAYEMFERLIKLNSISVEEIEKLKTKEYTKLLFNHTDYPVIADSRDANRGNSRLIRYRKKALIFNEKEIFITTQWFEGNRDDLVAWYKRHLSDREIVSASAN